MSCLSATPIAVLVCIVLILRGNMDNPFKAHQIEHLSPSTCNLFTSSPATFAAIRGLGGLAWVAHTEGRDVDELATLGLDGIELYQLHANLDPDIREQDLGLDPGGFLNDVFPFFFPAGGAPPSSGASSMFWLVRSSASS